MTCLVLFSKGYCQTYKTDPDIPVILMVHPFTNMYLIPDRNVTWAIHWIS